MRQVANRFKVGEAPLGIAAHPTNGRVYVADWFTHKISVVDPTAGKVVAEIAVGDSPSGLAVTPDGKLLLSADRDSDAVSIIDVARTTDRHRLRRQAALRHHHRRGGHARLHGERRQR